MNDDIRMSYLIKIMKMRIEAIDKILENDDLSEEKYSAYLKEKDYYKEFKDLLTDDNHLMNSYHRGVLK